MQRNAHKKKGIKIFSCKVTFGWF